MRSSPSHLARGLAIPDAAAAESDRGSVLVLMIGLVAVVVLLIGVVTDVVAVRAGRVDNDPALQVRAHERAAQDRLSHR